MADRVGQQLGNYRLTRLLGNGGFAEVYLGEHLHLHTQAAVKVLFSRLTDHDEVEGFEKEAQTIAHLKHPHIVRVFDFDVEDDTPFLVMGYAPHGTLRQRHPKGTILPLTTIIAYVKQVADALQFAHDQRLIHRDVKPENMLVGERDELLLSDFGIALMAQSSRYQSKQEVAGTAAYMAPEQFQGKPRRASDQYALSVVVYEWLCGDRPFHGSFGEIASQHLFVPPPPLRGKVPTISADVEQVVLRALEKDPHKRFASIQDFATALEQAYQREAFRPVTLPTDHSLPSETGAAISPSQLPTNVVAPLGQSSLPIERMTPPSQSFQPPVAAVPSHIPDGLPFLTRVSVPSRGIQPSKQRISRRAVMVGLAGLVVTGGGLTWWLASQEHQPISTHEKPGMTLKIYPGHSGEVSAVAWSPDGKRIASGSFDKTVQVWDAATGKLISTFTGHPTDPIFFAINTVFSVAWSPDGKKIVSGFTDGIVRLWDVTTDKLITTFEASSGFIVYSVAWSPNGTRIASGASDNTVQVWDARTAANIFTYRGHSNWVYTVAWSPDGKYIVSGGLDNTVQVWDPFTGKLIITYTGHSGNVYSVAWSPDGTRIASGASDNTVQVWDPFTGKLIITYTGHSGYVDSVSWSPDGKIASGGQDKTVRVWDATTGKTNLVYTAHSATVTTVAWSPDGKEIASGSFDKTIRLWVAM